MPDRVKARIAVDPVTGCWLWQGSRNREDGYGQIRIAGGTRLIHRVVYELAVGLVPDSHMVVHVKSRGCAHAHCCNPAHLDAVTPAESTARIDWMAARARR